MTHIITPSFGWTNELTENFKFGFGIGLPITINPVETRTGRSLALSTITTTSNNSDGQVTVVKSRAGMLAELKTFLKFYTVGQTPATVPYGYFTPDSLLTAIDYSLIRRNGTEVYLKLKDNFGEKESDTIAIKFEAKNYYFNNGAQVDLDENGIAGEDFYDDTWPGITIGTNPDNDHDFYLRGNAGWTLNVSNPFTGGTFLNSTSPGYTDPKRENVYIETVTWSQSGGTAAENTAGNRAMRKAILEGLKGNFVVEKNTGTGWANAGLSIEYAEGADAAPPDPAVQSGFRVTTFTPEHNTAYRVVYTGATVFETSAEYFGGKQRIKITGYNVPDNKHDPGVIRTTAGFYYNTDTKTYGQTIPTSTRMYSKDNKNQNVTFEIRGITATYVTSTATPPVTTNYFLKDTGEAAFKENFKVVVRTAGTAWTTASGLQSNVNYYFVDINKAEFLQSDELKAQIDFYKDDNTMNFSGYDVVRITLDPSFKSDTPNVFFYYNDKIVKADDKTTYGSVSNWEWGYWTLSGPIDFNWTPAPPAPPDAPTGLVAIPDDGEVELTWNASLGATGYEIQMYDPDSYSWIYEDTTSTSFTFYSLTNGTTYQFYVYAYNAVGYSASSAYATATPDDGIPPLPPLTGSVSLSVDYDTGRVEAYYTGNGTGTGELLYSFSWTGYTISPDIWNGYSLETYGSLGVDRTVTVTVTNPSAFTGSVTGTISFDAVYKVNISIIINNDGIVSEDDAPTNEIQPGLHTKYLEAGDEIEVTFIAGTVDDEMYVLVGGDYLPSGPFSDGTKATYIVNGSDATNGVIEIEIGTYESP